MLVLISDIHITDESTDRNVNPQSFDILKDEILLNAGLTLGSPNRNVTEISLVLLGDIYDLVRTDYWLQNAIPANSRPWGGAIDPLTGMNNIGGGVIQAQFTQILTNILNTNCAIALSNAIQAISTAANDKNVTFKVIYVIGNHDRVLWNFNGALQNMISNALLPAQPQNFTFASEVLDPNYGVIARHGHEWSEECYSLELYNKVLRNNGQPKLPRFAPQLNQIMAIGEVITAELMAGFIWRLKTNPNVTPAFLTKFMDIHTLRPFQSVFDWIDWFTRNQVNNGLRTAIITALTGSLNDLLNSSLAKKWDDIQTDFLVSGDITDRLEIVRFILGGGNAAWFDIIKRITLTISKSSVFSEDKDLYLRGAMEDLNKYAPQGIRYAVYGHTHLAMHRYIEGDVSGTHKTYINTGTYLPLTQAAINSGYVTNHQMTLLTFYNPNEDIAGKAIDPISMNLWNGVRRKL